LAAANAGVTSATTGFVFMMQSLDARRADAATLEPALTAMREQTLAQFAAVRHALGGRLDIAYAEQVNPPLWELGHVGWFEEFWIARNTQRHLGTRAPLEAARAAPLLPGANALYDSSHVAHAKRWQLRLPDARHTQRYLSQVRQRTLMLLQDAGDEDDALYFFRWALMHEAMHQEAGLMIAQRQGWPLSQAAPAAAAAPRRELKVAGGALTQGADDGGFAFDNELGAHTVALADFTIDNAPLTWRELLPYLEAGGALPAQVVRDDTFEHGFKRAAFGRWVALDLDAPAVHLSAHDAEAWCRWAGRRLPTEHEWVWAQRQHGDDFVFGDVWEWTASPFAPFPGFTPHPYRDYSAPWFDGRPVLKGGSFATPAFMKHPRYRNFFAAARSDVFAGFRSCAL
jgi:gamma-glutamyl hercynylcysteine S-oxide synthase